MAELPISSRPWHLPAATGSSLVLVASMLLSSVACAQPPAAKLDVDRAVLAAQKQRAAVMSRAAEATVAVFGLDGGGGGSGVIVTPDGYALTNYHVSSACGDHMRCGLNDGQVYDAVIVGVDATGDLSLIQLLGRDDFPTAPLADSNQVRVGQWCFAAGNPFVLATNLQPSISLGIVSGVNRYQYPAGTLLEYADCIQTDAAINPGNSGGPLFNMAGEVIGINGRCSFEKRGRVNVGVGYAISANQVKYFFGMLKSGRLVDHATLGATVSTDESGKTLVTNILSSSDAYRRGLRYGDEVLALADREVRNTNMFKNILGTLPRDWRVPLQVRRNGKQLDLLVRLDGVHTEKQLIDLVSAELIPGNRPEEEAPTDEEESQDKTKPADGDSYLELRPNKELVQSRLETRSGFANYFYNRMNRERLWKQLRELGDYSQTSPSWQFAGKLVSEPTAVSVQVSPQTASFRIGTRTQSVSWTDNMSEFVATRREKGLLVALRALQELLRLGPEQLGDTVFLGPMPIYRTRSWGLAEQPKHEVMQTLWYDATVRIYVDPDRGEASLIEVFGDGDVDPVELYLDQYDEFTATGKPVRFPSRIRLQYGTEPLLLIDLEAVEFGVEQAESSEEGTSD